MPRPRRHVLAWGAVAFALGCPACSNDDQSAVPFLSDVRDRRGTGGNSTAGGSSGDAGSGGTAAPAGGAGGSYSGGTPGSGGVGTDGGIAGASGGQSSNGGTDGGQDASTSFALSLCVRLRSPSVLAFDVTRTYDHKVYGDCRVKWVANLYLDVDQREVFLNNLLAWNMRFWGCNPPPPDDFALIFTPAPLTSADASALIDDYLAVTTESLGLSAPEIEKMRAALRELAKSVIATNSDEFSHSQCGRDGGPDATTVGDASSDSGSSGDSGLDGASG